MKKRTAIITHSYLLFLALILIASTGNAQTIKFSGEINQDTSWNYDTVRVDGDVVISEEVLLAISLGTTIEFQGKFGITVLEKFNAIGTSTDSIKFTYYDTTAYRNASITS